MSTTPRNLPRFLPTLTEVVHLSDLTGTAVAATPDLEETVWFVMQRVDLVIERRLREESDAMLRAVVTEKLQTLSARLRTELETVVRQAVSEAMTSQLNQHKLK
jgi:sensor domain CHASE-containing protein